MSRIVGKKQSQASSLQCQNKTHFIAYIFSVKVVVYYDRATRIQSRAD